MSKLTVNFSNSISTGFLYSQNEKSYENRGAALLSIFSGAKPETLGVEVVMVNDDHEIVFVFDVGCGKKGSSLIVLAVSDGSGLKADISGAYEVKLRKGVAPVLQKYGDKLDLRIRAITSNGGEWSGFISYISGISHPTSKLASYLNLMPKIKGIVNVCRVES
jgi:hypothetical protein